METFQERLKALIVSKKLTHGGFAESLGMSRQNISNILTSRNKPGYDFWEAFVEKYSDISVQWLIHGVGDMYAFQSERMKLEKEVFGLKTKNAELMEKLLNFHEQQSGNLSAGM